MIIREEFLYKQAMREGLYTESFVDSSINAFMEESAYQYFSRKYYLKMKVPENIRKYFSSEKIKTLKPDSVLPGMLTLKQYKRYYSSKRLHKYLFGKYVDWKIVYNKHFFEKEAKRINWNNPLRMFVRELH